MILQENKKYVNIKNDSTIEINILYYQNETKVCFYGTHRAKDGTIIENREYHLTLDKLQYWRDSSCKELNFLF